MDLPASASIENLFWIQFLISIAYLSFWIYALRDLILSEFRDVNSKLLWTLIILFVPLGPFFYLSLSRRSKKREFKPKFTSRQIHSTQS